MDEHIYKSHNKTLLMYHFVFPVKYRRKIFTKEVSETLKEVCQKIGDVYEMKFIEIGMEEEHVHMLVQGIPTMSVSEMVMKIKSITAREIYKKYPQSKKERPFALRLFDRSANGCSVAIRLNDCAGKQSNPLYFLKHFYDCGFCALWHFVNFIYELSISEKFVKIIFYIRRKSTDFCSS